MRIKLKEITMQNFKGIKDLKITFDGNMNIYGDNGTGKTTILDAFLWCLFGKNSNNASNFNIKPLQEDGSEIHNLDYKAELVFDIDGEEKTFTKVYKENWTRKRGSNDTEFSGHTCDYFINNVPVQEKLYKAEVGKLADEEIFKMITNLYYFNTNLDWKKRRLILMELIGNITDDDVIASNSKLKPLIEHLQKKSIDDLLVIAINTKKNINKKIEEIPIKIDELSKINYEPIFGHSLEDLKQALVIAEAKRDELIAQKSNSDSSNQLLQIDNERLKIENEIAKLKNYTSTKQTKLDEIVAEGRKYKMELQILQDSIDEDKRYIDTLKGDNEYQTKLINRLQKEKEVLEQNYDTEIEKEFVIDKCSYCGQALPHEMADDLHEKFNLTKATTIENIVSEGKNINEQLKEHQAQIEENNSKIKSLEDKIQASLENSKFLELQVKYKQDEWKKANAEPEINPNQNRIDELDAKLASLITSKATISNSKSFTKENELNEIREKITDINHKIALFGVKMSNDERIQTLIGEEDFLTFEYEKHDNLHRLCEDFITTKASLLENKVNSQFEFVKFKLFEKQVNGGIKEVCDATVNGVPYNDLNHAMQVNAGLDIIQALHKVYNVKAPVFIDNAESITKIKPIDTQIIRLVVSEADKKLRFENSI